MKREETTGHNRTNSKGPNVISRLVKGIHDGFTHGAKTTPNVINLDPTLEGIIKLINQGDEIGAISAISELEDINIINVEINESGETLLHLAGQYSFHNLAAELLARMSQEGIDHVDNDGQTALHESAINGTNSKTLALIVNKINFNLVGKADNEDRTALHYAADSKATSQECVRMVTALLKRSKLESIYFKTKDTRETALQLAVDSDDPDVVRPILDAMTKKEGILNVDKDGNTALHKALTRGQSELADMLWSDAISSRYADKVVNMLNSEHYSLLELRYRR